MHYLRLLTTSVSTLIAFNSNANEAFFENLGSLCGSTYTGQMTFPVDGQDSFQGKKLVAQLSSCTEDTLSIPFHVGDDKSRTWIISKTTKGLLFKHDHRHLDGSEDEISNYGGMSNSKGDQRHQFFPADEFTQQLLPAAASNVWSITLSADNNTLTYHLERHNKPRFTAVLEREPES